MPTRRDFMRGSVAGAAGLMAFGKTGWAGGLPESIRRAMEITPAPGSSFLDAEHIVVLMQENRSFDHCFGTLRGVRGFGDPRAMRLADGLPVFAQTRASGERFVPFRMDIRRSKITWMGSLPHGWTDQTDAHAGGRMDGWLDAKAPGEKQYASMPLTMGYFGREDIPFYHAMADAFTICDQHFCSSLTGTTPNRLYLWSGKTRESRDTPGLVRNEDVDYGREASWRTFPERLEDLGVSWKIYQNEISINTGLSGDEDAWLANFTDNPIEWFKQFNVRLHPKRREFVARRVAELPAEIAADRAALDAAQREGAPPRQIEKLTKRLKEKSAELDDLTRERAEWTQERWDTLSPGEKRLHERAFDDNSKDPRYRTLTEFAYEDAGIPRKLLVPAGDILHQFRADVAAGTLPAVSWLVAPERFSDHPGSAWFGAWYLSEVMDILTRNPEVWRKTIFILTYDENDGYFDHAPPFVAPRPGHPETGRVSDGIDTTDEYVELESDLKRKPPATARGGPIGLGFRVPLIVASPWSRGGAVCSQVFDHTSVIQLMERVFSHRLGRPVKESNISAWRRAVCGDLSAVFREEATGEKPPLEFLSRDAVVRDIYDASFKPEPSGFRALTASEVQRLASGRQAADILPRQEAGTRPSCPLPYELTADGGIAGDRFRLRLSAGNARFGDRAAGSPFIVHAVTKPGHLAVRHYAAAAGTSVEDFWPLVEFENRSYALRVYGPNGFFREFSGSGADAPVTLEISSRVAEGRKGLLVIRARNAGVAPRRVAIRDCSYGGAGIDREVPAGGEVVVDWETSVTAGWYDVSVRVDDDAGRTARYAGRIETGAWSISDPAIG